MVKKGFSLAEALVVMAIISIFFAAASKIITTKPKVKKQINAHGYYECYDSGGHKQKYVRDGVASPLQSVSVCKFEPPAGIAFFNVNSYIPCYSSFQPNINNALTISLGGSGVVIRSDMETLELSSNTKCSEIRMFFSTLYPKSEIYNNGAILKGVFISW